MQWVDDLIGIMLFKLEYSGASVKNKPIVYPL